MEYALEHLPEVLGVVLAAIITIALWDAVLKTGRNTQAMLAELRKTNAILLAAFGLEEGPAAKGVPRIVKSRKDPPELP
jgi:hypothetical protein